MNENEDRGTDPTSPFVDSESFLLSEFEAIREMRANLNSLNQSEIQAFISTIIGAFLALALSGHFLDVTHGSLRVAAIGGLFAAVMMGWAVFDRAVKCRIQVVSYARCLNRVRRYFVDHQQQLAQYVSPDICDNRPPFGAIGAARPRHAILMGNTAMIAVMNGVMGALALGILSRVLWDLDSWWVFWWQAWPLLLLSTGTIDMNTADTRTQSRDGFRIFLVRSPHPCQRVHIGPDS